MILHFNYEELTALRAGAEAFLDREGDVGGGVLAPPEERARVQALLPMLQGDLSLSTSTLEELRAVKTAVDAVVAALRAEMETLVVTMHAADEGAVAAYFDFAHGFAVSHRLDGMASEMEALIEVVTGSPVTGESARTFQFPD